MNIDIHVSQDIDCTYVLNRLNITLDILLKYLVLASKIYEYRYS